MISPKVSFRLPETTLQAIDHLIKNRLYNDRSAFFRKATEQLLAQLSETEESLREVAQ